LPVCRRIAPGAYSYIWASLIVPGSLSQVDPKSRYAAVLPNRKQYILGYEEDMHTGDKLSGEYRK